MKPRSLLAAFLLLSSTYPVASAWAQTADEQAAGQASTKESAEASLSTEDAREPAPQVRSEPLSLPPETSPAAGSSWPDQKAIGASVMILGGASIATGFVMGIITSIKYNDLAERGCTTKACPESVLATGDLSTARTFEYAMMGTLLGGVGALGAGIFIHAAAASPLASNVVVRPYVGLNQLGIAGSF
jgi:hypothetical protein